MSGIEADFIQKKEFEKIYTRFFNFFYDVAYRFLNHEEDAEGIVQEAFIKLWESKMFAKPESEIRNYLFILIRNRCLNLLRSKRKRFVDTDSHEYLLTSINYKLLNETGEDILLYQELFEKIQSSISNLSPKCKEVFCLSRIDDLSNQEISERLDISIKAVEANITRALKKLKEELQPYLQVNKGKKSNQLIQTILFSYL